MAHDGPDNIPPDPESERRGHELRDVAAKPIILFLIGLFVFGGVVEYGMRILMEGYVAHDTKVGEPVKWKDLRDHAKVGVPAAPQRDTTGDMIRMYEDENKILNQAGYDPKSKKYHIPIDRAIKLVAKKGLPHKDTPAAEVESELPYPKHSEPYMATEN